MSIAEAYRAGMRPEHPLAYNGFRDGFWMRDDAQILELHGFMQHQSPTGDEEWEQDVDACARRIWLKHTSPGWTPGDGYHMLLSLPSALHSMRNVPGAQVSRPGVNDELAKRGFEPLVGWEPLAEAGYMPRPAYFALSAAEIRRRRARFYFEDAFAVRPASISTTDFLAA